MHSFTDVEIFTHGDGKEARIAACKPSKFAKSLRVAVCINQNYALLPPAPRGRTAQRGGGGVKLLAWHACRQFDWVAIHPRISGSYPDALDTPPMLQTFRRRSSRGLEAPSSGGSSIPAADAIDRASPSQRKSGRSSKDDTFERLIASPTEGPSPGFTGVVAAHSTRRGQQASPAAPPPKQQRQQPPAEGKGKASAAALKPSAKPRQGQAGSGGAPAALSDGRVQPSRSSRTSVRSKPAPAVACQPQKQRQEPQEPRRKAGPSPGKRTGLVQHSIQVPTTAPYAEQRQVGGWAGGKGVGGWTG